MSDSLTCQDLDPLVSKPTLFTGNSISSKMPESRPSHTCTKTPVYLATVLWPHHVLWVPFSALYVCTVMYVCTVLHA